MVAPPPTARRVPRLRHRTTGDARAVARLRRADRGRSTPVDARQRSSLHGATPNTGRPRHSAPRRTRGCGAQARPHPINARFPRPNVSPSLRAPLLSRPTTRIVVRRSPTARSRHVDTISTCPRSHVDTAQDLFAHSTAVVARRARARDRGGRARSRHTATAASRTARTGAGRPRRSSAGRRLTTPRVERSKSARAPLPHLTEGHRSTVESAS